LNFCLHANEALNRLEQTPKLVIAALDGDCVGGCLEVTVVAERAGKMLSDLVWLAPGDLELAGEVGDAGW